MKKTNVLWVAGLCAVSALLLTGCPPQGVVCKEPTVRCGNGCVDPTNDRRNCGACGQSCQVGEVCSDSKCECSEGRASCDGRCVALNSDPDFCGNCETRCQGDEFCHAADAGSGGVASCQGGGCSPGFTSCERACVDTQSDPNNCGGCGIVCDDSRVCSAGVCTYDLVVACRNFGFVRGLTLSVDGGVTKGPFASLGTTPNSLASYEDVLLVTDDTNRRLLQASLATFTELQRADGGDSSLVIGNVPNQVYVSAPNAYVANAFSNTLQIIDLEADAGANAHPNGLDLRTVAEVNFGENTGPNGVVVQGQHAYVPLYGGFGAAAAAGQKLAKVDIGDAGIVETFDLTTLNLGSFDGGAVLPRPYAVAAFGGKVYVTLNNFDADYVPAGPGMLAEYDPASGALTAINLGADRCLNAVSFAQSADTLFVSCNGKSTYDASFNLISVENNGVLALSRASVSGPLEVKASWVPVCPAGTSCKPASIGRIAFFGSRVFVADQGEGRVWVVDYNGTTLTEATVLSAALMNACPPTDATNSFSNVADIQSLR